jgi:sortase A
VKRLSSVLIFLGIVFILTSFLVFTFIFLPVFMVEVKYQINPPTGGQKKEIAPVDDNFGIIIPKINANAKVIANVNPYNSAEYQVALTRGVAHALGTNFPGQPGNVFIFAHSSVDFFNARRFNSVFYLLDKLEKGDEILLYYNKEKFKYQVTEKKIVAASEVQYLADAGDNKTVTLMTCWPSGTTMKRLIVIGEIYD